MSEAIRTHRKGRVCISNCWRSDNGSLRYVAFATPSLIKGNTASDIRQRVSITMIYNLPFGGASKSFAAKIVHQWKLNVIGAIQSGSPLTVTSGATVNGATPDIT